VVFVVVVMKALTQNSIFVL